MREREREREKERDRGREKGRLYEDSRPGGRMRVPVDEIDGLFGADFAAPPVCVPGVSVVSVSFASLFLFLRCVGRCVVIDM